MIVLENPARWRLRIPEVRVVSARDYLDDPDIGGAGPVRVYNLCRTYAYQTAGYYVSLLAAARGHKPLPSLATLQDLRQASILRLVSDELEDLIDRAFAPLRSTRFELSVYFGRNIAARYDRLSNALFSQIPCPLVRAEFRKVRSGWRLERVRPIAAGDVPETHEAFVADAARRYFRRGGPKRGTAAPARYDLAILASNVGGMIEPSNRKAIRGFVAQGRALGLRVDIIDKDDYGRLPGYDALFIRDTTYVNHHTYRFSRRATAEGLVVIDDPESIIRCTNKVFLAEAFARARVPHPRTMVVHKRNTAEVAREIGLPCVVKQPDSSFSQGVSKAETTQELESVLNAVLSKSELAIAQAYTPTEFDWRVGVLDGQPLYVCKYYMARGTWTIVSRPDEKGRIHGGKWETLPVDAAPKRAVSLAVRAARLIGTGLYGVDIKQVGGRFLVIEVNDNPSIDHGIEDRHLGDEIYARVMRVFLERLEARTAARGKHPRKAPVRPRRSS